MTDSLYRDGRPRVALIAVAVVVVALSLIGWLAVAASAAGSAASTVVESSAPTPTTIPVSDSHRILAHQILSSHSVFVAHLATVVDTSGIEGNSEHLRLALMQDDNLRLAKAVDEAGYAEQFVIVALNELIDAERRTHPSADPATLEQLVTVQKTLSSDAFTADLRTGQWVSARVAELLTTLRG